MKARIFVSILLVIGVGTVVGCKESGPAVGTVSGIVTLEGEPIEGALVEFMPLGPGRGSSSTEKTASDGFFELQYTVDRKGALVGKHQVQISTGDWDKDVDTGAITKIKEKIPR